MAKDGKARQGTQGHKARHAIIIGKASARQGRKASAIAIGIGNCHRQGIIGMPSARHAIGIGRTQQQDAGRQDAAKWRSIVIQFLKECKDTQL